MKRYVQEKKEKINGETLTRIVIFEDKRKPQNYKYVVFPDK